MEREGEGERGMNKCVKWMQELSVAWRQKDPHRAVLIENKLKYDKVFILQLVILI